MAGEGQFDPVVAEMAKLYSRRVDGLLRWGCSVCSAPATWIGVVGGVVDVELLLAQTGVDEHGRKVIGPTLRVTETLMIRCDEHKPEEGGGGDGDGGGPGGSGRG